MSLLLQCCQCPFCVTVKKSSVAKVVEGVVVPRLPQRCKCYPGVRLESSITSVETVKQQYYHSGVTTNSNWGDLAALQMLTNSRSGRTKGVTSLVVYTGVEYPLRNTLGDVPAISYVCLPSTPLWSWRSCFLWPRQEDGAGKCWFTGLGNVKFSCDFLEVIMSKGDLGWVSEGRCLPWTVD